VLEAEDKDTSLAGLCIPHGVPLSVEHGMAI
jgi:hypothetical protein